MNPKEQFALWLRVIGVLGIIYILRAAVRVPAPAALLVIARLVSACIGLYLIRGAPLLVKFAYPDSTAAAPGQAKA